MKERKVYDREFKENAVKLSYERDNLTQFACELGISVKQLILSPKGVMEVHVSKKNFLEQPQRYQDQQWLNI